MHLIGLLLLLLGGYMAASEVMLRRKEAQWQEMPQQDQAVDVLARTIWGEARGEGIAGMQAVASVVINRATRGGWWGADVVSVCRKPYQFSCWLRTDPNLVQLLAVGPDDARFAQAIQIAAQAVAGALPDNTGGATHYHAASIRPAWAASMQYLTRIGGHLFYRGN